MSFSPRVRLAAALQQRQQHRMILITAVTLSFIIQTRQQFYTLNTDITLPITHTAPQTCNTHLSTTLVS